MICYFWHLGWRGCNGRLERCHMIPKQRLKKAGITAYEDVWDVRVWRWGCVRHHFLFDQHAIRLEREQYPSKVFEYAQEVGFDFIGPRTGWVQVHREAA